MQSLAASEPGELSLFKGQALQEVSAFAVALNLPASQAVQDEPERYCPAEQESGIIIILEHAAAAALHLLVCVILFSLQSFTNFRSVLVHFPKSENPISASSSEVTWEEKPISRRRLAAQQTATSSHTPTLSTAKKQRGKVSRGLRLARYEGKVAGVTHPKRGSHLLGNSAKLLLKYYNKQINLKKNICTPVY